MIICQTEECKICKCCLTCITFFLKIDAHTGAVNDLAFAHPNKQLCVVTCGEDKLIKVRYISYHKIINHLTTLSK